MSKLLWRTESVSQLAAILTHSTLENSAAVGTSTVYQILHEGREKLAVSLPNGQAIIIELQEVVRTRRRRVDPVEAAN